jgi:hypothetical protein
MTGFPGSPKLVKAGLVLIDPNSAAVERIITLQYNAESLTRSFQVQTVGETQGRSGPLRLTGPAIETINLEAELDATDQLEFPDQNPDAVEVGLLPQIAALETLIYPTSAVLNANNARAGAGTLEIAPIETPLALFVWSRSRIVPVQVTELSVTEEAFDANLNPIRAKVSLGLRVLSVDDLGFEHAGGSLFMAYLSAKEQLAQRAPGATLASLGIGSLP